MTSSVRHVDQEYEYYDKGRQRMGREREESGAQTHAGAMKMAVIMIWIDGNYNSRCKDIVLAIRKV